MTTLYDDILAKAFLLEFYTGIKVSSLETRKTVLEHRGGFGIDIIEPEIAVAKAEHAAAERALAVMKREARRFCLEDMASHPGCVPDCLGYRHGEPPRTRP